MYGGEEVTAACIESLLAQDYSRISVLLVDNASHDGGGARLRARFPGIEYLDTGGNVGYTGGNNRGIEHALARGADYVLILNNDTTLDSRCVSQLVETATQEDRVGAVAPKILHYDHPDRIWYAGGDFSRVKAVGNHRRYLERDARTETERAEQVSFVSGCGFLMPAPVARHLAGFAEDFFMYCEDVDLSLRVRSAGYHLYYEPRAWMYHREPVDPQPNAFQIRLRDRNRRRVVRRHFGRLDRLRFAAWFYPSRAMRLVQYLARGDWPRARAIVAGAVER